MNLRGRNRGDIPRDQAFTRVDLAAVIFIVFLVGAAANPLFTSHSRARSDTLICQANLAQIGRAYHIWNNDHEDRHPFLVPVNEGGLWRDPWAIYAYIQFAWISNGLVTPKVLACPADTNTTRRAKDFSANPDGGFMHIAYQNSAVSYFVGIHAQRYVPRSILSGDRNIDPRQFGGCSYVAFNAQIVDPRSASWGQQIHWTKGNLLFNDGSVEETSSAQLRTAAITPGDDPGPSAAVIHVVLPK